MRKFLFWFILVAVGFAIGFASGHFLGWWGLLVSIPAGIIWGFAWSAAAYDWALYKRARL